MDVRCFQKFNREKVNVDPALYDWLEVYEKSSGSVIIATFAWDYCRKNYDCACSILHKNFKSETQNQQQKNMDR